MRFKYDKNKKTNKVFALTGLMVFSFLTGVLHNKHAGKQFGDDTNVFGQTNRWIETNIKEKNCINDLSKIDASQKPTDENTRTKQIVQSIKESQTGNDYIEQADEKNHYICDGEEDLSAVAEFNQRLGIIHLKPIFKQFMNEITLSHEFHHHSQFQHGVFIDDIFDYRIQDIMAMIMAYEISADVAAMVVAHELGEKQHPTAWKQNFVSFHERSPFMQKLKQVFVHRYEYEIGNQRPKDEARILAAKQAYQIIFNTAIDPHNQLWNRVTEQSLQHVIRAMSYGLLTKEPLKMPNKIDDFGRLPNGDTFTNGLKLPNFCHITAGVKGNEQLINTLEDIRRDINPSHLIRNEERYGIFQYIDIEKAIEIFENGQSGNSMYHALVMSTGLTLEQSLNAGKIDLIEQCHPNAKRKKPTLSP